MSLRIPSDASPAPHQAPPHVPIDERIDGLVKSLLHNSYRLTAAETANHSQVLFEYFEPLPEFQLIAREARERHLIPSDEPPSSGGAAADAARGATALRVDHEAAMKFICQDWIERMESVLKEGTQAHPYAVSIELFVRLSRARDTLVVQNVLAKQLGIEMEEPPTNVYLLLQKADLFEQWSQDHGDRAISELNLDGLKLSSLPSGIGQFKHLTRLNLSNNSLTALPDALQELELKELNVLNNPMNIS